VKANNSLKKDGKQRRKKRPVVFRYGGASVKANEQ
jgi:hypothetical protein